MKKDKEESLGVDKALKVQGEGIPVDGDNDLVIPVCFGELSRTDVQDFKELWEKTWSSDSRFSKKPGGDKD